MSCTVELENDSFLRSNYQLFVFGRTCLMAELFLAKHSQSGGKVSLYILPHFLSNDLMTHSEENTLTQAGLYLAPSEPSQVSVKYGVKTS